MTKSHKSDVIKSQLLKLDVDGQSLNPDRGDIRSSPCKIHTDETGKVSDTGPLVSLFRRHLPSRGPLTPRIYKLPLLPGHQTWIGRSEVPPRLLPRV